MTRSLFSIAFTLISPCSESLHAQNTHGIRLQEHEHASPWPPVHLIEAQLKFRLEEHRTVGFLPAVIVTPEKFIYKLGRSFCYLESHI